MASVMDFLWNGKPPTSVTTYGQTTSNIPQFMSDYVQGMLSKANAVAAEPWQNYGAPRIAPFTQDQTNAYDMTRQNLGDWQSGMTQATQLGQSAGQANPLGQAQPYMNNAAQTWPQQSANYMNPYNDQVLSRMGDLAQRNLTENIMPGIGDQFSRAGQYGSSRMQEVSGRALRDTQESLLAQQGEMLNNQWNQSANQFQQDAARQGNLGQLAGNLTTQGANLQLGASSDLAGLARSGQNMGFQDAAALEGIGKTEQGQMQQNANMAYNDWLAQRDWPKTQLGFMQSAIQGLPMSTSATTSQTGPYQYNSVSPLASLAQSGALAGALGSLGQPNTGALYAKGGAVRSRTEYDPSRRAWGYYAGDADLPTEDLSRSRTGGGFARGGRIAYAR